MKTLFITFIASIFLAGMTGAKPCKNSKGNKIVSKQSVINTNGILLKGKDGKKPKEVSWQSKEQFNLDFNNVIVTQWERTKNFDEATFIQNGQTLTAFYDDAAKLVGTTTMKTFTDLPLLAQTKIAKDYNGYSVGDIILFDDNELNETDMILYNQPFEDADNYFIELKKDNKKIVVQSDMVGNVSYFTSLQ